MSKGCRVQTLEDLNNAKNKPLVREILKFSEDLKTRLTLYNTYLLEKFKGAPSLLGVRQYLEVIETKKAAKLTGKDRINILSMFVGKQWTADEFVQNFSENGLFKINNEKLSKYLSFDELNNISNNEELFRSLYFKIKKYNPKEATPIEAFFTLKDSFLSEEIKNPDVIEDMVKTTYAGVETEAEIRDKGKTIVSNNPAKIKRYMTEKGTLGIIPSRDIDINGRPEYYDNIRSKLLFIANNSVDFSSVQDALKTGNLEEISDFFKNELGINLNLNSIEGDQEDIRLFLENLYNFTITENKAEAAESVFRSYLKISPRNASGSTKKHSITEVEDAIVINSKSEQEVFDKHGALLVGYPNIYKQVEVKSVSWVIERIFTNEKSFIEDRSIFEGVQNLAFNESNRGEIELQMEANILKASKKLNLSPELVANKFLNQLPLEETIQIYPDTVKNPQFISNLFQELPVNGKDIFALRKDGSLYMQGQGEYSRKLLELTLSESMYNDIIAYANISMEPSMSHLRNKKPDTSKGDLRNFFFQNPKALHSTPGSKVKLVGSAVIAPGIKQDFIKVNGEVYEKVNDNVGLFEKIVSFQNDFNISEPKQSIDNRTAEDILEGIIDFVDNKIVVHKPEQLSDSSAVKNPDLSSGKKTLRQFANHYKEYIGKGVQIGVNNIFSFDEKTAFQKEILKLNEKFVELGINKHYSQGAEFYHIQNNNTYELANMDLSDGYSRKAKENVKNKTLTIPSQTLKEIEGQPFLTPEQIKDAHSALSDSDVKDWTEEDLDC